MFLNNKGQIMPFIAIMLIVILLFISLAIASTLMFLERKKVEDALDAAILSALVADVSEERAPTYYYDRLRPVFRTIENEDGTTRRVLDHYRVVQHESYEKNYIYLSPNYRSTINEYFLKNLTANSRHAQLIDITASAKYDDERFLLVKKNLQYLDPPSSRNGVSVTGRSYNPSAWWRSAFADTTGFLGRPEPFSTESEEERIVRYPRWIRIDATAKVRIPSFFGSFITGNQHDNQVVITVHAAGVKELTQVSKPKWGW